MKIRVFVGSTREAQGFTDAVVAQLATDTNIHCHPWNQGVFEVGGNNQTSLVREISECDFAVIILTADDTTTSRGEDYFSPRDNLIFEAGISFGAVHPTRTFLVPEIKPPLKLPTDLNGFTVTQAFDSKDSPKNAMAAPVAQIRQRIQELGMRPSKECSVGPDKLTAAAVDLLRSAEHTIILFGRDLSWAPRYAQVIKERADAGVEIEVFSDIESRIKARNNAQTLIKAGATLHYCARDLCIKLIMIDYQDDAVCQFMIPFKERNPSYTPGSPYLYRYTIQDASVVSLK